MDMMNIIDFLSVAPFIIATRDPWTYRAKLPVRYIKNSLDKTVHRSLTDYTIKPIITAMFGDSIQLLRLLRLFRMLRQSFELSLITENGDLRRQCHQKWIFIEYV